MGSALMRSAAQAVQVYFVLPSGCFSPAFQVCSSVCFALQPSSVQARLCVEPPSDFHAP